MASSGSLPKEGATENGNSLWNLSEMLLFTMVHSNVPSDPQTVTLTRYVDDAIAAEGSDSNRLHKELDTTYK